MTAFISPTGGGRLDVSASVVLNAAGGATLTLGPVPPLTIWAITRMTVQTSGPTNPMPTCYVYEGPARPQNMLDATWTGAQDVSDFGTPYELEDGQELTFVWSGGTAGTTATARLLGRQALKAG